jgi:hypothetical protein
MMMPLSFSWISDQLVLRKFTKDYSELDMGWVDRNTSSKVVQHGTTITQLYGFRGQWSTHTNWTKYVAPSSPIWKVKNTIKYAAGPPYMSTARDFYQIVQHWTTFNLLVIDEYPHLIAEMFAYCLAAIHVGLHPITARGFMVSTVGNGEGWYLLENDGLAITNSDKCDLYPPADPTRVPFVLHYCQRYTLENFEFRKHQVPSDFLQSCEAEPLPEPTILQDPNITDTSRPAIQRHRSIFMLCTLIPALNEAFQFFKQQHCA